LITATSNGGNGCACVPTSLVVSNGTGGNYAFSYVWPSGNANCTTLAATWTGTQSDTTATLAAIITVGAATSGTIGPIVPGTVVSNSISGIYTTTTAPWINNGQANFTWSLTSTLNNGGIN